MTNKIGEASPIELWLTQANMEVACSVVFEDERTSNMDVNSLSMRGAQRELTGYLIEQGYEPVGRWQAMAGDKESMRKFRLAK